MLYELSHGMIERSVEDVELGRDFKTGSFCNSSVGGFKRRFNTTNGRAPPPVILIKTNHPRSTPPSPRGLDGGCVHTGASIPYGMHGPASTAYINGLAR